MNASADSGLESLCPQFLCSLEHEACFLEILLQSSDVALPCRVGDEALELLTCRAGIPVGVLLHRPEIFDPAVAVHPLPCLLRRECVGANRVHYRVFDDFILAKGHYSCPTHYVVLCVAAERFDFKHSFSP